MRRCYRCHLRMVYRDDDDLVCLACSRSQSVQRASMMVVEAPAPARRERQQFQCCCEQCGGVYTVDRASTAKRQRFCSRSCRTTNQMRWQRKAKPWRELVLK